MSLFQFPGVKIDNVVSLRKQPSFSGPGRMAFRVAKRHSVGSKVAGYNVVDVDLLIYK